MHDDLTRAIDRVSDAIGTSRFARILEEFKEILEDALTEDRFDDVNGFISGIKVDEHSDEVLIALLEITKDASEDLPHLDVLWDVVFSELTRRGKNARVLLAEC